MKSKKQTINKKENLEKLKENWLKELSKYGILKKDYEDANKNLTKRFGKKVAVSDIIWSLFNQAIIKNINDPTKLSNIYFDMGRFIRIEGKNDPNLYFEQSTRALLQQYKKSGIKKIRFVASYGKRTCKSCSKLNGKIFDIEDALKNVPVPNKACKNLDDNRYRYCRCTIIALTELDDENK